MNKYEIINETDENIIELKEIPKLLEFALKKQNITNAIFNIIYLLYNITVVISISYRYFRVKRRNENE